MAEAKIKFDYTDKPIPEAIHEALGSASVCWDEDRVFDVETALDVGKALEERIDHETAHAYREGYRAGRGLRRTAGPHPWWSWRFWWFKW